VTVPFGDLARQTEAIRPELDTAVDRVLSSGQYLFGDELEQFERGFAAWCGTSHAVGVANGTDAITISLQAVGVRPGDEVITAANTRVPTVVGIENAGAAPVLVDAEPESRTLGPALVEAVIGPRTRAIVPVDLYGQCGELDALDRIAANYGLALVEDCAQAHGAEVRGCRAGSIGQAAAFSFYPTKNLGALGDGGAVVTSDPKVAERARLLRNYGERERFKHVLRGRNSRLDALQAALLTVKLSHFDAWTERRRTIAACYTKALQGSYVRPPRELPGRRHVYHLYVVEAPNRDAFRSRLAHGGHSDGRALPTSDPRPAGLRRARHRTLASGRRAPGRGRRQPTAVSGANR
jgi:dTDP-4-amino-4,6-dideoxygalactose transaminase